MIWENRFYDLATGQFLYLQKVGDVYTFGTVNPALLLLANPVPADLDKDVNLDYEEKIGISDTVEALQLDKYFVMVPAGVPVGAIDKLYTEGVARAVIGLAVKGNGTIATTLTKVAVDVGVIDEAGVFTSRQSGDTTPNYSTNSVTYQLLSAQALLNITGASVINKNERLCLRVRVFGHVASGNAGAIRILCARGSADSYMEIPLKQLR